MKFLILVSFFLLLNSVQCYWLTDVYTGLNEAIDDSNVKENIEHLGTKIKKVGSDALQKIKENIKKQPAFKHDWVSITKRFLQKIEFKEILKEHGDEKMEELVETWNGVFSKLNGINKESDVHQIEKSVKEDLKKLLTAKVFKKWGKKVSNGKKKLKKIMKKKEYLDVSTLKKSVKAWVQPSFMVNKENIKEEKQMVKDAVKSVNKKLKEHSKEVGQKIVPVIKMGRDKKLSDDAEGKLEKWLEKKFTKPHQESGQSKWELLLQTMPLDKMKRAFQNKDVPFKRVKKQFKKLAKMHKKLLVVKKPLKTLVKKIDPRDQNLKVGKMSEKKKSFEPLTENEKKEYEKAEEDWEHKIVKEAMKLSKKFMKESEKSSSESPKNPNQEVKMVETDDFDKYEEDNLYNVQQTKPKLKTSKEFADELMREEFKWMELKKKLKSML